MQLLMMGTNDSAEPNSSHALMTDVEVAIGTSDHDGDAPVDDAGQQDLPLPQLVQPSSTNGSRSPSGRFPYFSSCDFKEAIACLLFGFCCSIIVIVRVEPKQRPIPFQLLDTGEYVINLSYNESFDGDTVSDALGAILGGLLPLLLQIAIAKFCKLHGDAHATICCYLVAFGITMLTTFAVKNYVGYLRPAFYDLCQPSDDFSECTIDEGDGTCIYLYVPSMLNATYVLYSKSYKSNNKRSNRTGETTRKSFPSGHSSTSFCGLTLLTLYLHSRFGLPSVQRRQLTETNSNASGMLPRVTIYRFISIFSLAPMALAIFIAASRVVDNKHWPADVLAGALLGASVSNFVHGLWFS